MNRIEKTGRTVDDAVQAALKELGVSREDVLIEVLEEGKDALFGLIKRDAKVRVTVKEAEKAAAPDSFEEQLETVPETKDLLRKRNLKSPKRLFLLMLRKNGKPLPKMPRPFWKPFSRPWGWISSSKSSSIARMVKLN